MQQENFMTLSPSLAPLKYPRFLHLGVNTVAGTIHHSLLCDAVFFNVISSHKMKNDSAELTQTMTKKMVRHKLYTQYTPALLPQ